MTHLDDFDSLFIVRILGYTIYFVIIQLYLIDTDDEMSCLMEFLKRKQKKFLLFFIVNIHRQERNSINISFNSDVGNFLFFVY